MRNLLLLVPIALLTAGCSGGEDNGNVASAEKAAAAMPKKAEDLPKDMPPEARRAAEGAMKANAAMSAQQNAQMDAMVKATAGRGN